MKMYPICPKGKAVALHLTDEYQEGYFASYLGCPYSTENPYDFFDEYEKNYAWCIGYQKGKHNMKGVCT